MTPRPHQTEGLARADRAEGDGHRAICVQSPCGAGKTWMMAERSGRHARDGARTLILTNRRILVGQTSQQLEALAIGHGFYCAGYTKNEEASVSVASTRTLFARHYDAQGGRWTLPPFDFVEVDECHSQKSGVAEQVIAHYLRDGATVCGWSATPVDVGHIYKALVVAGTKARLRREGILVPCRVFAPDEPDLQGVTRRRDGEYVRGEMSKRVMRTLVFGDVFRQWAELNPERQPTILWAPGVEESRWFAAEFQRRGVRSAHVDGETTDRTRAAIFRGSRDGWLAVICSYGVLREGANMPWLRHGILVQACGAYATWEQVVGRLLRADPESGKTECILQDHSGAWWRHGSPNADRAWTLGDTNQEIAAQKTYERRVGEEHEPTRCPRCGGIRAHVDGSDPCPHCGHKYWQSVRMVRMAGGELVRVEGATQPRVTPADDDRRLWWKCLYAAASRRVPGTVAQAAADFRRRTGRTLPADLPDVPRPEAADWTRPVTYVFPKIRPKARRRKPKQEGGP